MKSDNLSAEIAKQLRRAETMKKIGQNIQPLEVLNFGFFSS